MKLNALLTTVFSKYGIDANSDEAKAILGNSSLTSIEVPDTVSKKFEVEIFTKDSALANGEIRSVIKAEMFNGLDSELNEMMKSHIEDEEVIKSIQKERNTFKRFKDFTEKVKELEGKKAGASAKGKEELTKQIDELNKQKSELVKSYDQKISDIEMARKMDKVNWDNESFYSTLAFNLPEGMSNEVKIETAKAIVKKAMDEKGLKFSPGEQGTELLTKDGTKYYENTTLVGHKDFMKKVLLDNKLLKVNEGGGKGGERKPATPGTGKSNTELKINTGRLDNLLEESIERLPQ